MFSTDGVLLFYKSTDEAFRHKKISKIFFVLAYFANKIIDVLHLWLISLHFLRYT